MELRGRVLGRLPFRWAGISISASGAYAGRQQGEGTSLLLQQPAARLRGLDHKLLWPWFSKHNFRIRLAVSTGTQLSVRGDLGFSSQARFIAPTTGNKTNEQFHVQGWMPVPTALDSPCIPPCWAVALAENRIGSGVWSTWAALPSRDRKTDLVKKRHKRESQVTSNSTRLALTAFVLGKPSKLVCAFVFSLAKRAKFFDRQRGALIMKASTALCSYCTLFLISPWQSAVLTAPQI